MNWDMEAVALEVDDPLAIELSTKDLLPNDTDEDLFGVLFCDQEWSFSNITRTSDIVGLEEEGDWRQIKAISKIFFKSSGL